MIPYTPIGGSKREIQMAHVERIKRVYYLLGGKRVSSSTKGAVKTVELSKDFYGVFRDHEGKRHRVRLPGITTKAKAVEEFKSAISKIKKTTEEGLDKNQEDVDKLITLYEESLTNEGLKSQTVSDETSKVKFIILKSLQVIRLEEIDISIIQEKLKNSSSHTNSKNPKPLSTRTKNFYIGALVRFGKWLKRKKYWDKNIFTRLKKFRGVEVKIRRFMTQLELEAIFKTAKARMPYNVGRTAKTISIQLSSGKYELTRKVKGEVISCGFFETKKQAEKASRNMTLARGQERVLFYKFLFYTLTRAGSAREVLVGQFNFKKDPAEVVLRGDQVKNKTTVTKPLHPALATELKQWIKENELKPDDRVFKIRKSIVQDFNRDLKAANIQKVLPDGTSLDIHSFKTTAISMLSDAGVPIKWIQHMAEHQKAETTLGHYARVNQTNLSQMFPHLPTL